MKNFYEVLMVVGGILTVVFLFLTIYLFFKHKIVSVIQYFLILLLGVSAILASGPEHAAIANDIDLQTTEDIQKPEIIYHADDFPEKLIWSSSSALLHFAVKENDSGMDTRDVTVSATDASVNIEKPILTGVSYNQSQSERFFLYQVTISVAANQVVPYVQLSITAKDKEGNEAVPMHISAPFRFDTMIPTANIELLMNGTGITSGAVKYGDTIQVIVRLDDQNGIGVSGQSVYLGINGSDIRQIKQENNVFVGEFVLDQEHGVICKEDTPIEITDLIFEDLLGNHPDMPISTTTSIQFYDRIENGFANLSFKSHNNYSQGVAKNGDKVSISFQTAHPVYVADAQIGQSRKTSLPKDRWEETVLQRPSGNVYYYLAEYTVIHDIPFDMKNLTFSIVIGDLAGNKHLSANDEQINDQITYYAPISGRMTDLVLSSDNKTNRYAKYGDTITCRWKTAHPVQAAVTIANQPASLTGKDQVEWMAAYTLRGISLDDNQVIPISIKLTDEAGNTAEVTEQDTIPVRFQKPIRIRNVKMFSDNQSNPLSARDLDTIMFTFETTHPVIISKSFIAGKQITFNSIDQMKWEAEMPMKAAKVKDGALITFSFSVEDTAGNPQVTYSQQDLMHSQHVVYFAPIQVTDVDITSDNVKDSSRFAKDGDRIYIRFKSNHQVVIRDASIAGKKIKGFRMKRILGGVSYEFSYQLRNGDLNDLNKVPFSLTAGDVADNVPITCHQDSSFVRNTIRYFAPLDVATSIKSNNTNRHLVKNGDTILIESQINHPAFVYSPLIMSRKGIVVQNGTAKPLVTYRISDFETILQAGRISFGYILKDAAGNELTVNRTKDNMNLFYDPIRPVIQIEPVYISFSKDTVTYHVSFADNQSIGREISLKVNGREMFTSTERNTILGKHFEKTITLSTEGNFMLSGAMKDGAGNLTILPEMAKVTIDRTKPQIKTVHISRDKSKAYAPGFKIADLFRIVDNHLDEVICTVTNREGTFDWNMEAPLVTEGKNTIFLLSSDKAGNVSQAVTYDVYIDSKQPQKVTAKDTEGQKVSITSFLAFILVCMFVCIFACIFVFCVYGFCVHGVKIK